MLVTVRWSDALNVDNESTPRHTKPAPRLAGKLRLAVTRRRTGPLGNRSKETWRLLHPQASTSMSCPAIPCFYRLHCNCFHASTSAEAKKRLVAVKATFHVYVLRCSLKDQTPMCKKELLMIALMSSPQCAGRAFNEDQGIKMPISRFHAAQAFSPWQSGAQARRGRNPCRPRTRRPSRCVRQAPRTTREAKS